MPWHHVTRALFIAAVAWAAALTRAFHPGLPLNLAIGVTLGLLITVIETRLRSTEVTDLLGALIGGAIGLGLSKTIGAALFWADASDHRVVFLHSFILLVFPYLGIVMGARKGEWLEPQRLVSLFRDHGALQDVLRLLRTDTPHNPSVTCATVTVVSTPAGWRVLLSIQSTFATYKNFWFNGNVFPVYAV